MWKRVLTFFALTMLCTMVLGGLQQATGLFPMASLPQLGPALGALFTLLIFRKDSLKLNFALGNFKWKTISVTLGLPFAIALLVLLITKLLRLTGENQVPLTALAIIWIPLGAIGEEIGWRGYLHKKVASKTPVWLSVLVVGVLWAAFHVQLYGNGALYLMAFLILILSYTVVITPVMIRSDFNIPLAALFHTAINFSNLLYINLLNDARFMALNALAWMVVAGAVILRNKSLFFPAKK